MNESEDWEVAVYCYSFSRDVNVQVQPVNVRHLHRIAVVVQRMLKKLELEICSIW